MVRVRRGAWLFLSLLVLHARAQDPDEPVRDGKWLYTRNCSGCHNDNGDGRGKTILQLGLTARDFKQGGFAFGDTREQMIRTVSTGIPGRSPMPSFKGVLSDEDIELVVDYTRTLMPPRKDEAPKNTGLLVHDKPVIARGKLPPIVEGAKEVPRGLLIGTPQGMTFEYDLEGVKLLGVRLGAFADREDWHDRGGGYLKPLGNVIHVSPPHAGDLFFQGAKTRSAERVLRSTSGTTLTYDLIGPQGRSIATIRESVSVDLTSQGAAFTRHWNCALNRGSGMIQLNLTGDRDAPKWRGPQGAGWWVSASDGAGAECVLLHERASFPIPAAEQEGSSFVFGTDQSFQLAATYLRVPAWSQELGNQLAKEILK